MQLDQRLVDAAIEFTEKRFPGEVWAGAAAMYTEDGQILISTALAVENESVALCHEVGAMCEAYAQGKRVVATVCVSRRESGALRDTCSGVCQERLWYWGGEVEVAVPQEQDSSQWRAVPLRDMTPHYWRRQFMAPPEL
jgi:cytidine deaminase